MKKPQPNEDLTVYAKMGVAAMLPGIQFALEYLQARLDEMRAQLVDLQVGAAPKKKNSNWRLSPEGAKAISQAQKRRWAQQKQTISNARKEYWAKMTPEQRTAEMRRRGMIKTAKPKQKLKAKQKPTVKLEKIA